MEASTIHNPQQLARNILITGRMIRDRLFRTYSGYLASYGEKHFFGELSLPQFTTLMIVQEHHSMSMNELAEMLMVSPPSASAMVDRLVEKGLLSRNHGVVDRRRVLVSISPESAQTVAEMERAILQSFSGLVDKLGYDTAEQWCQVLNRVKHVLEAE